MDYAIIFGDGALDNVLRLAEQLPDPLPFLDSLQAALEFLAQDPVNRGSKPGFPYFRRGQVYSFVLNHAGAEHHLAAYFQYCENEAEIRIVDITAAR